MASVSHPDSDRLLMGSPLRRSGVCRVICAVLLALLAFATLVHLNMLASMRSDVASVFYRALALSSVLAAVPLAVLWFLDRRERETPWLFAAANPRLSRLAISSTSGNSARTMSGDPSELALSTTMIWWARRVSRAIERRQSRSRSCTL